MSTTLTIRTDEKLRRALAERAAAENKTLSEMVREILEDAVTERPLAIRAGHLKGRLDTRSASSNAWGDAIRERNWRP